jgi:uncharacterized protein (DUF433 family)
MYLLKGEQQPSGDVADWKSAYPGSTGRGLQTPPRIPIGRFAVICYDIIMATTYLSDRITVNPEVCFGKPCIRGMRLRVVDVLDMLAAGDTEAEILEDFPDLELQDIRAVLSYAARVTELPVIVAAE